MDTTGRAVRAALACLACSAFPACNAAFARASAAQQSPPPIVATVLARSGAVRPSIGLAGVIAPVRVVGVSAAINEPIVEVRVREGQRVRAGTVLALLDQTEVRQSLSSAQEALAQNQARYDQQTYQSTVNVTQYASNVGVSAAAVAQAQTVLDEADTDLRRYEGLERQGYLPQQTLAAQRTTVATDRQALEAARAQFALARQNAAAGGDPRHGGLESAQIAVARSAVAAAGLSVAQMQYQLDRTTLRAPIDGVVASVNANVGEYPSGRQLFTIHDDAQMFAMLAAPSAQALTLRGGEPATIATTDGALHARGTVEAVLDQLSPGTTNFIVKVRVVNSDGRWRAGIPVTAQILADPVRGTVVPLSAYTTPMNDGVYAVRDGKVAGVAVRALADDGTWAVVDGVRPGTRILRDGRSAVAPGDAVGT